MRVKDSTFSFRSPSPEFVDAKAVGQWIVDVDLKDAHHRSIELPFSSKLNDLLSGRPNPEHVRLSGYWIRYAYGKIARLVNYQTTFADGMLVSPEEAIPPVFEDRGLTVSIDDKHSYAEGFQSLLGSDVQLLEKPGVRELLWRMKRGKTYTL